VRRYWRKELAVHVVVVLLVEVLGKVLLAEVLLGKVLLVLLMLERLVSLLGHRVRRVWPRSNCAGRAAF
jgi:hypothetical protein